MFQKFASAQILGSSSSKTRIASLEKVADWSNYKTDDGFLYVRVRAISSRTNKNGDSWTSEGLKQYHDTFIGKPIFVDHNNGDPSRARGVVVDSKVHVDDQRLSALDPYYATDAWDHEKPPTWVELLLEVDAKSFPRLAKAIVNKDIDGVSMGANVDYTICTHCANRAEDPSQFCTHIMNKGAIFDYKYPDGRKTSKKSAEICEKFSFFEISFVFDPADETALVREIKEARTASVREAVNNEGMAMSAFSGVFGGLDYDGYVKQIAKEAWDRTIIKPAPDPESNAWNAVQMAIRKAGFPHEAVEVANDVRAEYQNMNTQVQEVPEESQGLDTPHEFQPGMEALHPSLQEMVQGVPHNDPVTSSVKKVAENPPPQVDLVSIPQPVDTLRQEKACPLCGQTKMENNTCSVCGYQTPPEGLDNPDLTKANPDLENTVDAVPLQQPEQPPQAQQPMNGVPSGGLPPNGQGQGGTMGVMGHFGTIYVAAGGIYDQDAEDPTGAQTPPGAWEQIMQFIASPENDYAVEMLMDDPSNEAKIALMQHLGIPANANNLERLDGIVRQSLGDVMSPSKDMQSSGLTLPWGEEGNDYFRKAPPEAELSKPKGGFGNWAKKMGVVFINPSLLNNVKIAADPNFTGGRIQTNEKPLLPVTKKVSDRPVNQKTISDSPKPVTSKRNNT